MGKKGSWFSKVKKALSSDSKEKTQQKDPKPKKKWFGKQKNTDQIPLSPEHITSVSGTSVNFSAAENNKHAHSVALATAEAAVAAAEVVSLTSGSPYVGKSEEDVAAIKIQTAFRGHMARRALRALKGLVRLKSVINGQPVQRQAITTLSYMHTLAHIQSQIRDRRNRMSEENHVLKRQLQQKHEKLRLQGGEKWIDGQQSKEMIEARLLNKQDAAMRRERALAYAYSHQTLRNSQKSEQFTFLDTSNLEWGWSWLERWMAAREYNSELGSLKSSSGRILSVGEISKAYYTGVDSGLDSNNQTLNSLKANRPTSRHSLPTKDPSSAASRKIRSASTKGSAWAREEDSGSVFSAVSERYRRHGGMAGSSATDDESLVSTASVPSYMAPTESVKARSRFSLTGSDKKGSPRGVPSAESVKKRLSFAASPARVRRHSGLRVYS